MRDDLLTADHQGKSCKCACAWQRYACEMISRRIWKTSCKMRQTVNVRVCDRYACVTRRYEFNTIFWWQTGKGSATQRTVCVCDARYACKTILRGQIHSGRLHSTRVCGQTNGHQGFDLPPPPPRNQLNQTSPSTHTTHTNARKTRAASTKNIGTHKPNSSHLHNNYFFKTNVEILQQKFRHIPLLPSLLFQEKLVNSLF